MHELLVKVIPLYAAQWETLASFLGLAEHEIAVISKDNANQSIDGCRMMFRKWLQNNPTASWGKLEDALKLLRLSVTGIFFNYCRGNHTV